MALFSSTIIIVDKNYCISVADNVYDFLNRFTFSDLGRALAPYLKSSGRPAYAMSGPGLAAPQRLMGGLDSKYKQQEYDAGLAAQKFRYGAGLPGQQNLVFGTDASGNVDRSQSDEYKSQMAQYRNLIAKEKQQEAEDLGMKIWKQKYADTAMAQPGGAVGSYNPLLAEMFPETRGYAGTFAPIEEIQKGDLGTRAQGEGGWTLESLNPEAQQEATAAQANMATTAGMPALSPRERAQLLIRSI